jgi:hypothetical protein
MRILAAATFALAAAAAALATPGMVVAEHRMTVASSAHPVTSYRYPVLLLWDVPGVPAADELGHHVRAAHAAHLRSLLGLDVTGFSGVHPLAELAGGVILAVLVFAIPRLPRPTRRAVAEIRVPRVVSPQWRSPLASPPPRLRVFVTP